VRFAFSFVVRCGSARYWMVIWPSLAIPPLCMLQKYGTTVPLGALAGMVMVAVLFGGMMPVENATPFTAPGTNSLGAD
jgi:hypothetical protein